MRRTLVDDEDVCGQVRRSVTPANRPHVSGSELAVRYARDVLPLADVLYGFAWRLTHRRMAQDYAAECLAVARAERAQLEDEVTAWTVDLYREIPSDITSSMRTDRMADSPLEWEILNGAVLRKARKHGLAHRSAR